MESIWTKPIFPVIRPYLFIDKKEIMAIDRAEFGVTCWHESDFRPYFEQLKSTFKCYVAEWSEILVGYMCVIENKYSFELPRFVTSPSFRRVKAGKTMMEFMKKKLIPYGREDIIAVGVPESHVGAMKFFEAEGFSRMVENIQDLQFDSTSHNPVNFKFTMPELPLPEHAMNL